MDEHVCGLRVGQNVPELKIETFDPVKVDFGEADIAALGKKGKWTVLFFYPADFTFVWATEFAALAERYEEFKKEGAEAITVSRDTKFVHLAWQRDEKLLEKVKYPMGSDPTGRVCRLFGVLDEASGLSLRGTFLISPKGIIMNSEVNFYNLGRNIEEILRKIIANKHLAAHPTEACPAQWKKCGDLTLKPSAKMVGKVSEAVNK